jgi:hypothetical protein
MMGGMKRFDPIPLVHPGGIQPYAQAGGREPGPALTAMLAGRTAGGINPMDVQRRSQSMAKRRPRTLLDTLGR